MGKDQQLGSDINVETKMKKKKKDKLFKNKTSKIENQQDSCEIKENATGNVETKQKKLKKRKNTEGDTELQSFQRKKSKKIKLKNKSPKKDRDSNQPEENDDKELIKKSSDAKIKSTKGKTTTPTKNELKIIAQQKVQTKTTKEEPEGSSNEGAKDKSRAPSQIDKTVFVGNLPSNTKKHQLRNLLTPFGLVNYIRFRTDDGKVIFRTKIRKEAESLNAYVVMDNVESVEKALQLSGTEFKGRHIRVTKADNNFENEFESKRIIFVGNLKYSATDEKLYQIFSSCGELEYVRTLRNNKGCKGVAYVCFKKPESVGLAFELNNTMLDERPIKVERYSRNKLESNKNKEKVEKFVQPAQRRIMNKNRQLKKKGASGTGGKYENPNDKKKKKTEFRGVHAGSKKKFKKKKVGSAMLSLAKKIAPKF